MIAKILASSKSFSAVKYNDDKISVGKGELLELVNFPYSEMEDVKAKKVREHLTEISKSKQNEKFVAVQFHASISCKGKEYNKQELAEIGKKWMDEMGYKNQPYAIIFHNDTDNNHIHIVSTRVNVENGKKINDSNERYKSRDIINNIMERDYGQINRIKAEKKVSDLIKDYSFDSFSSMKTYLNSENYKVYLDEENPKKLNVYNSDWKAEFNMDDVKKDFVITPEDKKRYQALLYKYNDKLSSQLYGYPNSASHNIYKYDSEFTNELRNKLGIEIKPVVKDGKVTNYTLVDHNKKYVLNGNAIMNSTVLFKDEIKTLDLTLINSINKFNINSTEKLEALSDIFNVPKFALDINYKNDNDIIRSYKNFLNDNPNSTIEDLATATNSKIFSSNGENYLLNQENGFFENVNSLKEKKEKIGFEVEPKFELEKELDLGEVKNIIHSISGALKTGEDNGNVGNTKSRGKRKKR